MIPLQSSSRYCFCPLVVWEVCKETMAPLLEVTDLRVYYKTSYGPVKAVDGVSFTIEPGERYGLIGESGSGKSTIALSLMRLHKPPAQIVSGKILLDGVDILKLDDEQMRKVRLAQVALITQGAMNSINPVIRIKDQLADCFRSHDETPTRDKIDFLLTRVGLSPEVAEMYSHQLSGGMKQRVCIAIAISLHPKLIIADEPTSALDVVVQRRIMQILKKLQEEMGVSVILIGHDMGLMAQFADRVGVMYAGRLVEESAVKDLFTLPKHPYSQLLMNSLPDLEEKSAFQAAPGAPPSLLDLPSGCVFHPRCRYAMERCRVEVPLFREVFKGHRAACHLLENEIVEPEETA
jgi:peptide/nickel transport system ATP-binding protein